MLISLCKTIVKYSSFINGLDPVFGKYNSNAVEVIFEFIYCVHRCLRYHFHSLVICFCYVMF